MSTNQIDLMKLFQRIKWAENGDTVPFTETNYGTGWSFLGDDTPTVEDFNTLQQWNDKKDQWLYGQIARVCQEEDIQVTESDLSALLKAIKKIAEQPQATTQQVGITQLDSSTNSTSETTAATPKAVKTVKDLIDALTRNLQNFIPNSKKSSDINSTSSDNVATSYAVKKVHDIAQAKQNPATTLAGYGVTDFLVKSAEGDLNHFTTDGIYSFNSTYTTQNAPVDSSGHLFVMSGGRENASWCRQIFKKHYSGETYERWQADNTSSEWSAWVRVDGADWLGVRGKPTTLNGYGITDAVKLQDLRGHVASNLSFDDATPAQLPLGTFVGLSSRAALTSQPANGWKLVSKGWLDDSGKYSCVRLGIVGNKFYYQTAESWHRWGTPIELATANDYVKKSGDTMSGAITFNGLNQLFMQTENRWNWHYAIKLNQDSVIGNDRGGIAFNTSGDIHFFNRQNSSVLGGIGMNGTAWFKGDVVSGNGKKLNDAHQITQPYVETTIPNSDYGGANFRRRGSSGNWDSCIEPMVDKRWKFWVQNSHEIFLPAKDGTVLLDNDFTYQKTGGFEIRKYPDGTMIQTFVYEKNDIYPERDGEQTFAWAAAFVERPLMMGQITSSYNGSHDTGINILSKSTNARAYYYFYEHGNPNQGLCRVQFVGIGRWK